MRQLVHRRETGAHGFGVDAADHADDRRVRAWSKPSDMKIGDPRIAVALHMFADFGLEVRVGGIQERRSRVAHQRPRPNGYDGRPDNAHHRVKPDPTQISARQQRDDRKYRCQRVGEHMDKSRPQIVIAMAGTASSPPLSWSWS